MQQSSQLDSITIDINQVIRRSRATKVPPPPSHIQQYIPLSCTFPPAVPALQQYFSVSCTSLTALPFSFSAVPLSQQQYLSYLPFVSSPLRTAHNACKYLVKRTKQICKQSSIELPRTRVGTRARNELRVNRYYS